MVVVVGIGREIERKKREEVGAHTTWSQPWASLFLNKNCSYRGEIVH